MPEVRCRGLDIHYEEHGSGPPIVWVPGTGLRGSTWELCPELYRVYKRRAS